MVKRAVREFLAGGRRRQRRVGQEGEKKAPALTFLKASVSKPCSRPNMCATAFAACRLVWVTTAIDSVS